MPFTLSHPAAILPIHALLGRRASLSALVIGSMVPDLPYFMGFGSGAFSHSLTGVALFCLPYGLLCYLLFHLWLKRPLKALLPGPVWRRMPVLPLWPAVPWPWVGFSLGLGALTHLLWDGFTHANGVVVQQVAWLHSIAMEGDRVLHPYKWLQHFSSLAGMLAMGLYARNWYCRAALRERDGALAWQVRYGVCATVALAGLAASGLGGRWDLVLSTERRLFFMVVNGITVALLALAVFALCWHLHHWWRHDDDDDK
jgi:hypothetical protein